MLAIINFEFLVSPALSSPSHYERLVDDIRILSELIKDGNGKFLIEEDSVTKMAENKLYPSVKIYQKIISQLNEEPPYGAEDVVRMVNSILDRANVYDSDCITHIVEWMESGCLTPVIHCINDHRGLELKEIYESLIIENEFSGVNYSPVYFHPKEPSGKQMLNLVGSVKNIFPTKGFDFPFNLNSSVGLYYCLSEYLSDLDGFKLFKTARTKLEMKFSLYSGALRIIKENKFNSFLDWDSFKVGDGFINSLIKNECYQEQQYASVLYESIIYILAQNPKNEIDYFYKSDEPDKPRVVGDHVAHRVHLTKSGRALRLLMWREKSSGNLIFANVGNKNELYIETP